MRNPFPRSGAALIVTSLVALSLAGCRGGSLESAPAVEAPPSAVGDGAAAGATAAGPDGPQAAPRPLPGVADERPAPADTPGLDKAETAQAAKPDGYKENLDLAFSYYKAKAYAQSAPAFERAARLKPADPKPLLYQGYSQMAAGALEPAIKTFEAVIALPEVSRDVQSEAYLQIGNAAGALGETEKAMEAFSKSVGNNPRQGLASLALGARAAERGQVEQARDFFRDAANDLPKGRHQASAFAGLGRLAENQGDRKAAREFYKKAIAADEDNRWAKEGLERLAAAPAKPAAKKG